MKFNYFKTWVRSSSIWLVVGVCSIAQAAAPPGYYNSVNTSSPQALHDSLHQIIDDHQRFPYTSSATDTWDILESADQDPNNSSNVLDIYKNASYAKQGGGNSFYNREHSWPKSYGFPSDGSSNYAYTDAHHLFISDSSYNSSRSNKPYDNCDSGCTEKTTEFNDNRGGTTNQSNWTAGSFTQGKWETWTGRRGEVARALLYMAVRYDGGTHGITGFSEPDLRLTDDRALIEQSNTGSNISVAYMGLKTVLLQWHNDDPVDDMERRRNDIVYSYQGNRNPFIDNPEYVACVFANDCSGLGGGSGDTTAPNTPTGLAANGGDAQVNLSWNSNSESDLAGYHVYRSNAGANNFIKQTSAALTTNSYTDSSLPASTAYDYYVTAIDTSFNESSASLVASAVTNSGGGSGANEAWINEFHYDNSSTDTNEFVEIAGSSGINLSGWSVIGYNGNGGSSYKTVSLSGVIPNQSNGFGTLSFAFSGMQNGSPDGLALVDNAGNVVQFISYEGTLTATNGPASGMTSVNIGVSETTSTPVGYSLQLAGTGSKYADFTWQAPSTNTSASINSGQSFTGGGSSPSIPVASFTYSCNDLSCNFDGSTSSVTGSSITTYHWSFGDSNIANGVTTNHAFSVAGTYSVSLEVTSAEGTTDLVTQLVTVTAPTSAPTYYQDIASIALPDRTTVYRDIDVQISSTQSTASVSVDISHSYRGDISLRLYAPDGTYYNLKSKNGRDGGQDIKETYSVQLSGNTVGVWTLRVRDHYNGDSGTLNSWSMQF
ncbi:PKD domain-containing protein [Aliikangiella marina]|uniref:PKD domain-containing protein n=1 Tax=Aliikangiella marina TaxID=1712262 RepID=A0A545TJ29_9GAMM|nr:endonuclease [Aliikangiella marina]TQV77239.1 PKD domain-containing protein [Aliikangiella marina]